MTKYSIEDCQYVTELAVTWKYMKICYPKDIFDGKRYTKFEGGLYPIPLKAEEYLNLAFGDYLNLPPKKEQVPKHDAIMIDLHKSYKVYKGKYYLKKEI